MYIAAAIIVFIALSVYLFYASYYIGSGVYIKAQCSVATKQKEIFLTFDDGPSDHTKEVLDVLDRHNAKAIFFIIGKNAESNPEMVKQIMAKGHQIGNHSYCHKGTFPLMSSNKIAEDIRQCNEILTNITGLAPTLFRPPFGVTNPLIAKGLKKTNIDFHTVGWNIRSFDTMEGGTDKILKRITDQLLPGSIILLHDRMSFSAELLDQLLTNIENEGWKVGVFKQ